MQINVNTDRTIDKHQGLDEHVEAVVQNSIGRFGEQISRIDVHLSNENSQKQLDGGNRCMMEAHVAGYAPVVVSEHAINLHQAITNAGNKLKRALDSALGRLADKGRREPLPLDVIDTDNELEPEQEKNLTTGM
ncbi:HPF/RaiA family ribosome-associated protein [Massilia sp. CMS3.1]|uniref:HPF/RaiA family ribosome-associated protein n=1 Tax=Massilia sp. CMS3.1 TaxID=3373083 RepID=UPI003EE5C9C9